MTSLRWDLPLYFRGPIAITDSQWLHNQAKSQAGQDLFVVAMTQGKTNGTWLELGCGHPIGSNNTYLLEKRLSWSGISIDSQRMDNDIITPFEEYWQSFYHGMRQPDWPISVTPFVNLPVESRSRYELYYKNFIERQITDIDLIPHNQRSWSTARPNTSFYQQNVMFFDFEHVPKKCDYLQVDIHPSSDNLKILQKILPSHRFTVITFEHDVWDHTLESRQCRERSRQLLTDHGYQMVISDVTVPPGHGNGIGDEPINFEDWWVDPLLVPETIIKTYLNLDSTGSPKYYFNTLFCEQSQ